MPVDLPRAKPLAKPRRWAVWRLVATAVLLYAAKAALSVARACMWLTTKLDRD